VRARVKVELHVLKCNFGAICIKCRQRSSPFAAIKGKHILPANCGQLCWLGVAKTVEQVVWADCGRTFSKAALYSAVTPLMCVTSQVSQSVMASVLTTPLIHSQMG